jgi:hypothetical protein
MCLCRKPMLNRNQIYINLSIKTAEYFLMDIGTQNYYYFLSIKSHFNAMWSKLHVYTFLTIL